MNEIDAEFGRVPWDEVASCYSSLKSLVNKLKVNYPSEVVATAAGMIYRAELENNKGKR